MQLKITDAANQWFKQKYHLVDGNGVKFFGKTVQPRNVKHESQQGYAREDQLDQATIITKKEGINYHINFADGWFFSGLITTVDYQPGDDEPTFNFQWEHNGKGNVDAATGASSKYEDYWE